MSAGTTPDARRRTANTAGVQGHSHVGDDVPVRHANPPPPLTTSHSAASANPTSQQTKTTAERIITSIALPRLQHGLERDVAGPAYEDGGLVFCDEIGRPIHPQKLTNAFRRLRKAAKIPTGSLHVLRHTAVTLMLTSGIPLHVVAARIGDRPETVLSTYAHLLPTSDEAAADIIASALVAVA